MAKKKTKKELLKEAGWITLTYAAELMGLSYSGAYKLVRERELRTLEHKGKAIYVSLESVRDYIGPEMAKILHV